MASAPAYLRIICDFTVQKSDPDAQNEDRTVCMSSAAVVIDGASTSIDATGWVESLEAASRAVLPATPHGERIAEIERLARLQYEPPATGADPKLAGIQTSQRSSATVSIAVLEQIDGTTCWSFEAVGDVGILLMRADGEPIFRRPDLSLDDFDSTPAMIRSNGDFGGSKSAAFTPLRAEWNDRLIMFSDGLGEWITQCATIECLGVIASMTATDFAEFVQHERTHRRMPDDDATLVIGRLEKASRA